MKNVRRIPAEPAEESALEKQALPSEAGSSITSDKDTDKDTDRYTNKDTNKYTDKEKKQADKKRQKTDNRVEKKKRKKNLRQYMDGSIILKEELQKYWPILFLFFFFCLILIANNYLSESMVREINGLKKEVKELRFRQLSTAAERMSLSRQSSIAKRLDSSGVKESVVPPIKLRRD